jgi:hypothetical protein
LNFINPLIDDNYSYEQIATLLNEKYSFEINASQMADLAYYYKDYKRPSPAKTILRAEKGKTIGNEDAKENIGLIEEESLEEIERKLLNGDSEANSLAEFKKEVKTRITW